MNPPQEVTAPKTGTPEDGGGVGGLAPSHDQYQIRTDSEDSTPGLNEQLLTANRQREQERLGTRGNPTDSDY